jgi:hypothetical protein
MNGDGHNSESMVAVGPAGRRSNWPLVVVAALLIIVPFFAWYGTWFGRALSDEDIAQYLADEKNPRHVQHALSRIEDRIERSDPTVRKFYPQIVASAKSPVAEVRKTAAWVMGQDNQSEDFHRALSSMLTDDEPLVRRNAALQLVRFGDAAGKTELRAMLQPYAVGAPFAGRVVSVLPEGSIVEAGSLLARIEDTSGAREFRSPLNGLISKLEVREGGQVDAGQTILWLIPDRATLRDALQALAFVGTSEDLPAVNDYTQGHTSADAETRQQALVTAKAIESRTLQNRER